jgi:hypothetical protein
MSNRPNSFRDRRSMVTSGERLEIAADSILDSGAMQDNSLTN